MNISDELKDRLLNMINLISSQQEVIHEDNRLLYWRRRNETTLKNLIFIINIKQQLTSTSAEGMCELLETMLKQTIKAIDLDEMKEIFKKLLCKVESLKIMIKLENI